ncbi:MAG: hypothetical protein L6Q71_01105 [Planctomycetes bacterium]|nr:hypothetical protein [Planctomycetota bacterium]NUQ33759.1 hypothetical protein [Planctomycetaceae bacterium]
MKTHQLELVLKPEALALERVLATLRRRNVDVLRFAAAKHEGKLMLSLTFEGKDEHTVRNLLSRLHDVEELSNPSLVGAGEGFWNHFENPFG